MGKCYRKERNRQGWRLLSSFRLEPSVKFYLFVLALFKTNGRLYVTSCSKRSAYEGIGSVASSRKNNQLDIFSSLLFGLGICFYFSLQETIGRLTFLSCPERLKNEETYFYKNRHLRRFVPFCSRLFALLKERPYLSSGPSSP